MKVSRLVGAGLATLAGVVAVFLYPTSTNQPAPGHDTVAGPAGPTSGSSGGSGSQQSAANGTSSGSGSSAGSSSTGSSSGGSGSSSGSNASGTFTGDVEQTRWGPVQVKITVAGGKVTAADAVRYPDGNGRDYQINSYAIPALNQEAVGTTTGKIDAISGATVTSGGYIASLQSAIDQAFHA